MRQLFRRRQWLGKEEKACTEQHCLSCRLEAHLHVDEQCTRNVWEHTHSPRHTVNMEAQRWAERRPRDEGKGLTGANVDNNAPQWKR